MINKILGISERVAEIRKALECDMFLSALSLSLTIPDICGKLEAIPGNDKQKYICWFDKYITPQYFPEITIEENDELGMGEKRAMTGIRCYGLRCAVLHHGNEELFKRQMDLGDEQDYKVQAYRIYILDDPEDEILYLNGNIDDKIYEMEFYLNIRKFCERICKAAEATLMNHPDENNQYTIELSMYENRDKEDDDIWYFPFND